MALGGIAELFLGVKAENAQLEDIAKPLTAEEAEGGAIPGEGTEGEKRESEDEQRWRSRAERARARRYRPGPGAGETFYSPGMFGTAGATRSAPETLRDREIDAIANALDGGSMRVAELASRVGARRWGPGRFRTALESAVAEGRVRRLSRTTVGPPRGA
jgi:hypothetical protein